jgi:hypothetical protein
MLQWSYGERSELIYQQNGVIFWIAGDQYDGIGEKVLWNTAQSLQTIPFSRFMLMKGETANVTQVSLSDVRDPFTRDVLVIYDEDSSDSAYFISVSSYQSEKSLQKTITRGH